MCPTLIREGNGQRIQVGKFFVFMEALKNIGISLPSLNMSLKTPNSKFSFLDFRFASTHLLGSPQNASPIISQGFAWPGVSSRFENWSPISIPFNLHWPVLCWLLQKGFDRAIDFKAAGIEL